MRNSDIFSFLTPPPKNQSTAQRNTMYSGSYASSNLYRSSGKIKSRKPIFQKNQSLINTTMNFSTNRGTFQEQKVLNEQVIVYDFCGCQNQVTPCEVVQGTFLKNVSLIEMKNQYAELAQKQEFSTSRGLNQGHKKSLYKTLPKFYPQLYYTHLNNLLNLINENMNWAQFSCLSWIQYHTKVQYVTFFLYQDLKKSFKKKAKFTETILDGLLQKGSNFQSFQSSFFSKGYGDVFQKFLSEYYDSVGANLIPVTHYSRFIRVIFLKKESNILYKFLVNFIQKKTTELEAGLRLLNYGQIGDYRNYIRSLNWDGLLEQIQE